MCDSYSLSWVADRPATVDELSAANFVDFLRARLHRSRQAEGSRVLLPARASAEVEVDHVFRRPAATLRLRAEAGEQVARFRQVNMDRPDAS